MSDAMTDMRNNKKLRDEIESIRQQLSSRDVEVADWRGQAHRSQSEADRLEQERAELLGAQELNRNAIRLAKQREAKLREQVKLLRDALEYSGAAKSCQELADALAATEQKE